MMNFFSSSLNFLRQKRLILLLVILSIVVTGVCYGASTDNPQYTDSDLTKNIIEIFNLIFGLLAMVLGPMVILAGWLLSPDWTMGDFFGLRPYFLDVWILVANIVYIVFALMLLYMAIMQIFGGPNNEYAFKKKLGPFLVGILIVPFTWLIVSWTLSFANQAVAAVLSIPMGSISKLDTGSSLSGEQDKSLWHKKVLPKEFNFSANTDNGYGPSTVCDGGTNPQTGARCMSPAEFLSKNDAGPFFIIMVYAYNIFKIQDANKFDLNKLCVAESGADNKVRYETSESCIKSLMGIVRNFGLSLIVTIFFAIMLIALCWILLMRAIKLWIYIMLSPLFGLAFFTGEGLGTPVGEGGESGMGSVGFKAFFKLAMVPVLVSAVLAFGLLFVGVVRDNFHSGVGKQNDQNTEYCTKEGVGNLVTYCIVEKAGTEGPVFTSRLLIGTTPMLTSSKVTNNSDDSVIILNFGDTFSNIIGGAGDASIASAGGATAGLIGGVEDIFAHLILTMLALVFMFMGVSIAAKYDDVTKAAFAPFEKLGNSVGNFVAHSPSYLPLPHPSFAMMDPKNITGVVEALRTKYDAKAAAPGKKMAEMITHPEWRNLSSRTSEEMAKLGNQLGSSEAVFSAFNEKFKKMVEAMPDGVEKNELLDGLSHATTTGDHAQMRIIADRILNSKNTKLTSGDKSMLEAASNSSAAGASRNININGTSASVSSSGGNHSITQNGVAINITSTPPNNYSNEQLKIYNNLKSAFIKDGKLNSTTAKDLLPDVPEDKLKGFFGL